ncbi:Variable major outer membrane lipoprotein (plasmid) [Borrelia crocidurae DOU]|uniref:Variable large protein n=1 Tax=Borrelia crocidurae DOU TaxID=1293575 RepID=W5SL95_9SPIR|nr:variable large family protein [Borrelia crocidurae]AHH07914.1 Variable major outer membrane lipoprotein [Borrelia crocidurae DOU]
MKEKKGLGEIGRREERREGRERRRIVMMMMVVMVMVCNSGGVSGEGTGGGDGRRAKSLSEVLLEVGRSTENVFYSFLGLIADTLGFTAKATTKKSEVGEYFNKLGSKLGEASEELEKVAIKASAGVDKDGVFDKAIKTAVDTAKITLSTLKGHLESLKGIGDGTIVGGAVTGDAAAVGTAGDESSLVAIIKALKLVVQVSEKENVGKLSESDTTLSINGIDNKNGAKILATKNGGNPESADVGKAAAILASVSGKEILKSIVTSKESDLELSGNADANTSAVSFAKGGTVAHLAGASTPKAASVAGGIALRSLIKTGKLGKGAADNATGGGKEVQGVGITAVNKLLNAIEEIVKKTVKNVLEKVKKEVDEARKPKNPVSQ